MDRLAHLVPLDLSTARVEPMDAARNAKIRPTRLRVGMYYDGRPVYRFQNAIVDPPETWLYIDPHRGTVAWREQKMSRIRRWLYNGLHKFDLPYLMQRPLWDVAMILLSIGGMVLSITTVLPAFRRLRGHAVRFRGRRLEPARQFNRSDN